VIEDFFSAKWAGLAERLKKVRKEKNITQIVLPEKADIETTYLSDLDCPIFVFAGQCV
jgi:hypothetical protein